MGQMNQPTQLEPQIRQIAPNPGDEGGRSYAESGSSTREDPRPMRITVDLEANAAQQLRAIVKERGVSISQAVRQALSLLELCDDKRYVLVLRDRADRSREEVIRLLP